jgi:hypothetical protein
MVKHKHAIALRTVLNLGNDKTGAFAEKFLQAAGFWLLSDCQQHLWLHQE